MRYVLEALVPYTNANLKLAFSPNRFFNELEKISNANRDVIAATLSRAKKNGLVQESDGVPILSLDGKLKISFKPRADKLKDGRLLVMFDIPESKKRDRDRLRHYLMNLDFKLVQRSIWLSDRDYREDVKKTVRYLELDDHVDMFVGSFVK